jgi:hypothetical protein
MTDFIAQACISLRPEAGVSIDDNGIHWYGIEKNNIPTDTEITAETTRLKAEYDAKEYTRKRVKEYPSIGDQLDALFHAGVFPAEMAAEIQAVKDKYPKG